MEQINLYTNINKMKTITPILVILLAIRVELIKNKGCEDEGIALCSLVMDAFRDKLGQRLSPHRASEEDRFRDYLHHINRNRTRFFEHTGKLSDDMYQFHWQKGSYQPRLNWLNKQIKIEQDK